MKKGFAISAILYTLLLLFLVLMVNILNNLQNKKVILDALKEDTINALQSDVILDTLLEQIGVINNKVLEIQTKINKYEANTYTKEEVDALINIRNFSSIISTNPATVLNEEYEKLPNNSCSQKMFATSDSTHPLYGPTWVLETCRVNASFGFQEVRTYGSKGMRIMGRQRSEGTWYNWYTIYE